MPSSNRVAAPAAPLPRDRRPQAKVADAQRLLSLIQTREWDSARQLLSSCRWDGALDPDLGHIELWEDACDRLLPEAFARALNGGASASPEQEEFGRSLRRDPDWMISIRQAAQDAGCLTLAHGAWALRMELSALGDISHSREIILETVCQAAALWAFDRSLWPLDELAAKKGVRELLGAAGRRQVFRAWAFLTEENRPLGSLRAADFAQQALARLDSLAQRGFVALADGPAVFAELLARDPGSLRNSHAMGAAAFALLSRLDPRSPDPEWGPIWERLDLEARAFMKEPEKHPPSWRLALPLAHAARERMALATEAERAQATSRDATQELGKTPRPASRL